MEVVKSPINYMGNKRSLINDLKKTFPNNINNFYDIFGGSGVVSLNMLVNCNKVFYNELDNNIFNLFKFAMINKKFTPEILKQLRDKNLKITKKEDYYKIRKNLNLILVKENPTSREDTLSKIIILYLQYFTFKHIIRFNNKNLINGTCGLLDAELTDTQLMEKFYYKSYPLEKLNYLNDDAFNILKNNNFNKDDFIYLDPPYTNTGGGLSYCDGWDESTDKKLFALLDNLTKNGIRWGMSNVFLHRGRENAHLIKWAEKNNYNISYFEKTYTLAKNQKGITKEVYIFNYKSPKPNQLTLEML